jgi:uncharacterized membrane protein SirB2
MFEYYPALRHSHIALALLSVSLFVVRGSLVLARSPAHDPAWLKYPSYLIDTLLLTAALMLTTVIQQYPFATDWLTMKVVLLVVYVVLGSIALKRGKTRAMRAMAFAAALVTVAFLFSVARTHHPLGAMAGALS